jgi:hypothetical protein
LKFNIKFIFITLFTSLVVVPFLFNILFLWDSGMARGETSDWFTLYGNIFGGLIGGFFTYLALLLTIRKQKEDKVNDMRPRMDIPHQSFDFVDDENDFKPIKIELNNLGGSIAKNIECTLSLTNYEEVISTLEDNKNQLNIDLTEAKTIRIEEIQDISTSKSDIRTILFDKGKNGQRKSSLGGVTKNYSSEFIGTCIPLVLNYEAKTHYILEYNVGNWIKYIVRNRKYSSISENELFKMNLKIRYSSNEYGEFEEDFMLEWKSLGIWVDSQMIFKYVLKSCKVNK